MSNLRELYQEVILEHCKSPRNFRVLETANRSAKGHNPLCGDKFTVYVQFADDVVKDLSFEGSGCAISTASASLMTECLKGKSRQDVEALFQRFHNLVTGKPVGGEDAARLGKLAVMSGVSEFPIRVKCATLAWHALLAALDNRGETVKTE